MHDLVRHASDVFDELFGSSRARSDETCDSTHAGMIIDGNDRGMQKV
jgi:hypothetical protein